MCHVTLFPLGFRTTRKHFWERGRHAATNVGAIGKLRQP
jgi:hypothetical protein